MFDEKCNKRVQTTKLLKYRIIINRVFTYTCKGLTPFELYLPVYHHNFSENNDLIKKPNYDKKSPVFYYGGSLVIQ